MKPSAFPVWLPWRSQEQEVNKDTVPTSLAEWLLEGSYIVEEVSHVEDEPAETGQESAVSEACGNRQTTHL